MARQALKDPSKPSAGNLLLTLFLFGATLAYVVFPMDLIPDFLAPLGFVDDVAVAAGLVVTELVRYGMKRRRMNEYRKQQESGTETQQ